MRNAFTLIELMIVIAVIAVIASIAVPNYLESRITAAEAAAATSLRSGIYVAQTQFQSGGYSDLDNDGVGEYACGHAFFSGTTPTAYNAAGTYDPAYPGQNHSYRQLALLGPQWNVPDGTIIGGYAYAVMTSPDQWASGGGANDYVFNERFWVCFAAPQNSSNGRRAFTISATGIIFGTKPDVPQANLTVAAMSASNAAMCYASCPWQTVADSNTTYMTPYRR